MNINATLLVQAGNFFIAYLLFRVILLKPACRLIDQENSYNESLQEQVQQGHEQIEEKKALQKKQWVTVHQFYKKNHPIIIDRYRFFQGMSINVPVSLEPVSDAEVQELAQSVANHIALQIGQIK